MTGACSRLKHDASEPANRDLGPYPCLVDKHKCAIEHVEFAVLEEYDARPVLHRDRAQRHVGGV